MRSASLPLGAAKWTTEELFLDFIKMMNTLPGADTIYRSHFYFFLELLLNLGGIRQADIRPKGFTSCLRIMLIIFASWFPASSSWSAAAQSTVIWLFWVFFFAKGSFFRDSGPRHMTPEVKNKKNTWVLLFITFSDSKFGFKLGWSQTYRKGMWS